VTSNFQLNAEEEARFRLAAITESSDDAILSKNLDGIITSWNDAACRMFGYTEDEIVGHSILKLIPPELHADEAEFLRKLRAGERIHHYETIRLKKNGELFDVSLTISPVRNSANEIIGSSKIARNISDRKILEQRLIQADKIATMGRMAATIAHEINNPLESIINLLYLARTAPNLDSEVRGYLLTAESEIERVSHIARQTLGYYRDTGAAVEIFLPQLIREILTVYESRLKNRNIVVTTAFDDPRPVMASPGELVQAFSNLLANSIDAMPAGGTLRIEIHPSSTLPNAVEVLVRDQGVGIEKANLAKVFEPFFTTKGNLGTGIGLWVTKQLVEKHGGHILLTSSTDPANCGTSITLSLPINAESVHQSQTR
jgi:PAS domain S-box-containing protein